MQANMLSGKCGAHYRRYVWCFGTYSKQRFAGASLSVVSAVAAARPTPSHAQPPAPMSAPPVPPGMTPVATPAATSTAAPTATPAATPAATLAATPAVTPAAPQAATLDATQDATPTAAYTGSQAPTDKEGGTGVGGTPVAGDAMPQPLPGSPQGPSPDVPPQQGFRHAPQAQQAWLNILGMYV